MPKALNASLAVENDQLVNSEAIGESEPRAEVRRKRGGCPKKTVSHKRSKKMLHNNGDTLINTQESHNFVLH